MKKCKSKNCLTCSNLDLNLTFTSTTYKTSYTQNTSFSCDSTNLIYLITCSLCHLQYIGETGDTIRNRLNNHRSNINTKKQTPIGIHFNLIEHNITHLRISLVEQLDNNPLNNRKEREYYWQNKLGTIYPKGLNGLPLEFIDQHHYRKLDPLIPTIIIRNNNDQPDPNPPQTITTNQNTNNATKDNSNTLTINLSSYTPSMADLSLLEKGLTYIPTPRLLPVQNIINNKQQLIRTLKLKDHFKTQETALNPKHKTFTEKSTWAPKLEDLSEEARTTIEKINTCTSNFLANHSTLTINEKQYIKLKEKHNLTHDELTSLKKLKSNKTIIIKPADKGGATVILDTDNYIREANRQLDNNTYYRKLDSPIYMETRPKIHTILKQMHAQKIINKKQLDYLSGPSDYKQRTFYLLPKIHKNKDSWPHPNCPAGRPIISDVDSESYRISEFIDYYINPLAALHPSYIKNTYDFLSKIRGQYIDKDFLLVTADVESLYTNMNINRTLACIKNIFRQNPAPGRPDKHIIQLLDLTLNNNDFDFNGQYYLQTCGTAMGKKYAPALANIYLLNFDHNAINNFRIKPLLYFRYLDDVFFIWPGNIEELLEFENFLNGITIGIKIKFESSPTSVNFLDTTIFKTISPNESTLQSKVYFKATDTHQLLHTSSFHPSHTTKGILKSQLIRFKRISSYTPDYLQTCKTLFNVLKNRGYTYKHMKKAMLEILYNYKEPEQQDNTQQIIPIVIDNNSINTTLAKEYRTIIENNTYFNTLKIITAYKNPTNLKQSLVHSKLS